MKIILNMNIQKNELYIYIFYFLLFLLFKKIEILGFLFFIQFSNLSVVL
jgi:hypothetical protein